MPVIRQSPSGPDVEFTITTDDIENLSEAPGVTVSDALDALYDRPVEYLDLDDDPVGLWNFNDTLSAVRGPALAASAGTFAFTDIYPGLRGIWLNVGARLLSALDASLVLLGAMSVEVIIQLQSAPPQIWICGVGGTSGSEAQANNVSWSVGLPSAAGVIPRTMRSFWERGAAGTDVVYETPTAVGSPSYGLIHQICSMGYSRSAAGIVSTFYNGLPFAAPSTAQLMPDGGGSGVFSIGAQSGSTSDGQLLIASIAVYNRERLASEWRASYNRSLGIGIGLV